jgi:5-methylcytosine-specific restriction endonuclease McrA
MGAPPDLAPVCTRCQRRHLAGLPCWGGQYAQQVRLLVLEIKGDTCWLCGHPGATTADHVQPRSRGGLDALDNLRPAHRFCNTGRGAGPVPGRPVPPESSPRW